MDRSGVGANSTTYFEMQSNGLNFFEQPPFDSTLKGFNNRSYKPINSISSEGPFLFQLGGNDFAHYSMLSTMRLEGYLKVTKADGGNLGSGDKVSIVNLFPHALFDHINVTLNGVPVADHSRHYAYKSYIQTHYSFSHDVKMNNLASLYYVPETATATSNVNMTESAVAKRGELIETSKKLYFSFFPYIDIASANNFLPPSSTLELEFQRGKDTFALLASTGTFKIEIVDLSLKMRHVYADSQVGLELEKKFGSMSSYFAFQRCQV